MSNRTSHIEGVHPELIIRVMKVLGQMQMAGFPMMICSGVRTAEEQHKLYLKGRDLPGDIVTNCDGYEKKSNHQLRPDGFGHAVDCCFLLNGVPSWAPKLPWTLYGARAKDLGLIWGGDWKKFPDQPHVELPETA